MKNSYFRKYLQVAPLSHALWRAQEAKVVSKVKISKPVLDMGCGFGEFAGAFFKNMVEIGIDISKKDLILAAQKKSYKKLIWADARELPLQNGSFNTVISISTLEHIKDAELAFREAYRVLKPGGKLIVTMPTTLLNAKLLLPNLIKKVGLGRFEKYWLGVYHWFFKHERLKSKRRWLSIIKSAGFKVQICRGTMSDSQIIFYEFFLLPALPTQLFRLLFGKRLLFSPPTRAKLLYKLFSWIDSDENKNDANIFVVAQK